MPHMLPVTELRELSRAQYQRGDYKTALATLDKAIDASPGLTAAFLHERTAILEKLDDLDLAIKDARLAIRLDTTHVIGYLRAGRILEKMNKHDKALEIYKHGVKKVTDNNSKRKLQRKYDLLKESLFPSVGIDPLPLLPVELVEMILSYLTFSEVVYVLYSRV